MLLTFGKYKNKNVDDVFKLDKHYVNWLIKQQWFQLTTYKLIRLF